MQNRVKVDSDAFKKERERVKRATNCTSDEKLRLLADISSTPFYDAVRDGIMTVKIKLKLEKV